MCRGRSTLLIVITIAGAIAHPRAAWGQTAAAASAQPPPLPKINLNNYPPVSRAPIASALGAAKAHPDDAGRVGEPGMLLNAGEQLKAAAAVYARASVTVVWAEGRAESFEGIAIDRITTLTGGTVRELAAPTK